MAAKLLIDIEQSLRELCSERGIPVESVRFFGSRARGAESDDSDV
jgi:predicted nucleotidyltransferase